MLKMTREEFYKKYGEVEVIFSTYYRYTFNYIAVLPDGKLLVVSYRGGNSGDIYRHEVTAGRFEKVINIQPFKGEVYEGTKEIEGFYDY